jgi:oligopeptide/dipeptide ABC transporter ATP-binding protein
VPTLLSVRDLVKEFPIRGSRAVVHAVSGVSFDIERGETLALVGESGSGKTTVGRCIVGLIAPTAGKILWNGVEVSAGGRGLTRQVRPKIQWVCQNPLDSLDPMQRIGDVIAEPLKLTFGLRGAELLSRVRELAEIVGLPLEVLERYPYEIGGGYQQRAAIARSFATDPDLVVLDEPTWALDPLARMDIIELLTRLQQESGVSYLFISHDLITVESISSRVAVMYLGKIVEVGPTDRVFAVPCHPYSRALLSSVLSADPAASRQAFTLRGEIPSPIHLPPGCALASRCPLALAECRLAVPPLAEVGERHRSACIRVHREGELDLLWRERAGADDPAALADEGREGLSPRPRVGEHGNG